MIDNGIKTNEIYYTVSRYYAIAGLQIQIDNLKAENYFIDGVQNYNENKKGENYSAYLTFTFEQGRVYKITPIIKLHGVKLDINFGSEVTFAERYTNIKCVDGFDSIDSDTNEGILYLEYNSTIVITHYENRGTYKISIKNNELKNGELKPVEKYTVTISVSDDETLYCSIGSNGKCKDNSGINVAKKKNVSETSFFYYVDLAEPYSFNGQSSGLECINLILHEHELQ